MQRWTRWTDWTNVVLGVYLMCVPLFTVDSDGSTVWVAELVGVTVALVGIWGLGQPDSLAAQGSNVSLGAGLVSAPFVFGYTELTGAAWNAYGVGATVAVLALCAVPMARRARAGRQIAAAAPHDRLGAGG
jgi:hypothetical protein